MKKYTSYTEIKKPFFNFSELVSFPILPVCAIALVSYGILFFLGFTVMLVANVVVSVVITYLYLGLKNATPNGSSIGNNSIFLGLFEIFSLLATFLGIVGVVFIINVGGYILVTFQQTRIFYESYFYVWLFAMFGIPVLYYLIPLLKYKFQLYYQAYHFTALWFDIIHDYELLISDIKVTFLQTKNKHLAAVILNKSRAVQSIEKLNNISVLERNKCLYGSVLGKTIYIPKTANRLKISWYSIPDDVYYEDEIDFPFNKLEFQPSEYPLELPKFLRKKLKDNVRLSILPDGKIELITNDAVLIEPVSVKSVEVSEEKKKQLQESYPDRYQCENLSEQINAIKQSKTIEKRVELKDYVCHWQLAGTDLEDYTISVRDVRYHHIPSEDITFDTFKERRLPISFVIIWNSYYWLTIHIDAEKLYSLLQNIRDKKLAISFDFKFDLEKGNAELIIKNNDEILPFTAWEKEIITSHWEKAKNKFYTPIK